MKPSANIWWIALCVTAALLVGFAIKGMGTMALPLFGAKGCSAHSDPEIEFQKVQVAYPPPLELEVLPDEEVFRLEISANGSATLYQWQALIQTWRNLDPAIESVTYPWDLSPEPLPPTPRINLMSSNGFNFVEVVCNEDSFYVKLLVTPPSRRHMAFQVFNNRDANNIAFRFEDGKQWQRGFRFHNDRITLDSKLQTQFLLDLLANESLQLRVIHRVRTRFGRNDLYSQEIEFDAVGAVAALAALPCLREHLPLDRGSEAR